MWCVLTRGCWKNQLIAVAIATAPSHSLIIRSLTAFAFVADHSYWLLFCCSSLHLHHNFLDLFLKISIQTLLLDMIYFFYSNSDFFTHAKNEIYNWKLMNFGCHEKENKLYKFIHKNWFRWICTHAQCALRTHWLVSLSELTTHTLLWQRQVYISNFRSKSVRSNWKTKEGKKEWKTKRKLTNTAKCRLWCLCVLSLL